MAILHGERIYRPPASTDPQLASIVKASYRSSHLRLLHDLLCQILHPVSL